VIIRENSSPPHIGLSFRGWVILVAAVVFALALSCTLILAGIDPLLITSVSWALIAASMLVRLVKRSRSKSRS